MKVVDPLESGPLRNLVFKPNSPFDKFVALSAAANNSLFYAACFQSHHSFLFFKQQLSQISLFCEHR